jgi:putative intracellular protease/amidase
MKVTTILLALALALFSSCGDNKKVSTERDEDQVKVPKAKKVLFVLTSHEDLGETGNKTGFWLEEFSDPYYFLLDKGVEITIASPKGGQPPIDPTSATEKYQTEGTKRFQNDTELQELLSKTVKLTTINVADYDAVFYPGGHGPLWDLAEDKNSIAIIEGFYKADKPLAIVCHSPGVLKNTKKEDGSPLVKGLKVTGFSNSEEAAVGLSEVVPFLVEDMLTENGAIYSKGEDWAPYVVEDGVLITGQNPASAKLAAEKLLSRL